jgi:acyl-CoA dehydrogenase
MDLELTPEQQSFRDAVRRFCLEQIPTEYVRECDREHRAPTEAHDALARTGWLGIGIPEEYGGSGGGAIEITILLEILGEAFLDLALWVFRDLTYGARAILLHGSEQLKQTLLSKVAAGDTSVCFGLTEPDSGSDASTLTTKAIREGNDYIITGQKMFMSGVKVSHFALVAVRTETLSSKHEGISTILVPTDADGFSAEPLETLGNWSVGTSVVFLDEVRVPMDNLLGEAGTAWGRLKSYLEYERMCLSAARTGAAQAALTQATEYAKTRHQFGQPISKYQAISHKLADMQVSVTISRFLVYRYADRLDRGKATTQDAAILKLYSGESYKAVADAGLQVLGGYGYTMDYDLQRHFRESRLGTIGGGTSEIQRNIIAKTMGL